jgi:membrane-bound lytic murein transglycosylase A
MKATLALLLTIFSAALVLTGCPKQPDTVKPVIDIDRPLPAGQLALRKITDPGEIPDFTPGLQRVDGLNEAISYSIDYLSKPSSAGHFPYGEITRENALASLKEFSSLVADLKQGKMTAAQLNDTLHQRFDVWVSVGHDMKGSVMFTGYYTPVIHGSLTRTEVYRYPLYGLPDAHKVTDKGTVALADYDRKAIEQGHMLEGKAKEIVWLDDPFLVYVVQVQGSAKVILPDGTKAMFGYAGCNGYDYHSIRTELINDAKIDKDKISLKAMIDYFKQHPGEVTQYTWRNPRFVFFARNTDPFPHGSLNEPVYALRTIATDKSIFPRACLAFVATTLPWRDSGSNEIVTRDFHSFALDQDTGGGIRAAGHCDIYMGIDENGKAADLAGRTVQDGKLYYLFLKSGNGAPAVPAPPSAPAPPATTTPPAAPPAPAQ